MRTDLVASAIMNGYIVVKSKNGLAQAVADGYSKVLGLFVDGGNGKTVAYFRADENIPSPTEEPTTLAEMTSAALDILEEDRDGFFLMVEGSQIDWENHAENINGQVAEFLGFDAAIQVVLEWVEENGKNGHPGHRCARS